jgi:hypothetical protein
MMNLLPNQIYKEVLSPTEIQSNMPVDRKVSSILWSQCLLKRFPNCAPLPPRSSERMQVDCVRDKFILNEIWAQGKIYILTLYLVEMFYLSLSTGTGSEL